MPGFSVIPRNAGYRGARTVTAMLPYAVQWNLNRKVLR